MTRAEFLAVLDRLAAGWAAGDAEAVAAEFAAAVRYADPMLYRFGRRADLVPFFEPPPSGHSVVWHRVLFDEAAQSGAVEYTYDGHRRYHGAAVVEVDGDGRIAAWFEWQHRSELDWDRFVGGPDRAPGAIVGLDHVQLAMPPAGETAARAFYVGVLGLREVAKPAALAGRGGCWFVGDGATLHLGVEEPFRPATKAHPALVVADLGRLRSSLGEAGIAIDEDTSGLAVDRCYVHDPFGNRVELVDHSDAGFTERP